MQRNYSVCVGYNGNVLLLLQKENTFPMRPFAFTHLYTCGAGSVSAPRFDPFGLAAGFSDAQRVSLHQIQVGYIITTLIKFSDSEEITQIHYFLLEIKLTNVRKLKQFLSCGLCYELPLFSFLKQTSHFSPSVLPLSIRYSRSTKYFKRQITASRKINEGKRIHYVNV